MKPNKLFTAVSQPTDHQSPDGAGVPSEGETYYHAISSDEG